MWIAAAELLCWLTLGPFAVLVPVYASAEGRTIARDGLCTAANVVSLKPIFCILNPVSHSTQRKRAAHRTAHFVAAVRSAGSAPALAPALAPGMHTAVACAMPAEAAPIAEAAAIEAGSAPTVEIEAVLLNVLDQLDVVYGELGAAQRIERARLGASGRKHDRGGGR